MIYPKMCKNWVNLRVVLWKIYPTDKKFTRPPVAPVAPNINSANCGHPMATVDICWTFWQLTTGTFFKFFFTFWPLLACFGSFMPIGNTFQLFSLHILELVSLFCQCDKTASSLEIQSGSGGMPSGEPKREQVFGGWLRCLCWPAPADTPPLSSS